MVAKKAQKEVITGSEITIEELFGNISNAAKVQTFAESDVEIIDGVLQLDNVGMCEYLELYKQKCITIIDNAKETIS